MKRDIELIQALFRESPLRSSSSVPGEPPTEEVERLQAFVDSLESGLTRPLTLVVMGEVKAGKSTMINALAGAEVSPTNVLESTATIIRIEHGTDRSATLERTDGSTRSGTIEEVFALLEEHRGDSEFFAGCRSVHVRLPLPALESLRLVDTPGLATITDANEAVTREFIKEADLVLWVFDSSHMGQADIIEEVADVAKLGKPVVGILNRVDELEQGTARLVRFARQQLGIYTSEFFPLSAKQAYNAVVATDEDLRETSGLATLQDYLSQEINARADHVKHDSVASSLEAAVRLEAGVHESYLRHLTFLREQINDHRTEVFRKAEHITDRLQRWVRDQVRDRFLFSVREELYQQQRLTAETIQQVLNEQSIRSWWAGIARQLNDHLVQEWKIATDDLADNWETSVEGFWDRERQYLEASLGDMGDPNAVGEVMEGAKVGTVLGTAAGTGLAVYAAGIGPAAAAVTFGAAAAAFLPPALLAGAIGGAVLGLQRMRAARRTRNELAGRLDAVMRDLRDRFADEVVEARVVPAIKQVCLVTAEKVHAAFVEEVSGGLAPEGWRRLVSDMEEYLGTLKRLQLDLTAAGEDLG